MIKFRFADLHCHPNLKSYGHSFSGKRNKKQNIWYRYPPNWFNLLILKLTGITKFSQSDLSTMVLGNVKIAFVSYYPFEKGFFQSPKIKPKYVAFLANIITSIGYNRIRFIQNHTDYFADLLNEMTFMERSKKAHKVDKSLLEFTFIESKINLKRDIVKDNILTLIPTIEGAHIFNSGLKKYGKPTSEEEILDNISKLKNFKPAPLFITFAHNFNNDLCGHAPSLEKLGDLVDQSENLDKGFSSLGITVLHALLSADNGKPIYIDVKHMSTASRLEYYQILNKDYSNEIPIIVSHGAVTGTTLKHNKIHHSDDNMFAEDSINFYDEELVIIAKSKGLFAIQLDVGRLAKKEFIKKSVFKNNGKSNLRGSANIVWQHIKHIAEVLDKNGLPAWDTCCIGSDFDGTTNPLDSVWTSLELNNLANELLDLAEDYLTKPNNLVLDENKNISSLNIIHKLTINNTLKFINIFY
jgi:microsomal dipeptidase-like Zn-dependent dipeptidase